MLLANTARKAGVDAFDRTIGEDDGLSDPLAYFHEYIIRIGLESRYHLIDEVSVR